ncbi:unnamed protein product [Urochloa decumbens]|uniref:Protein kinase domain-containing protein n=1 Tax=Urochloa decumbens TaxID=240449 RepID=A0ABC9DU44_9POAL
MVLLVAATFILQHSTATDGAARNNSLAKPGCQDKCGNVSIPYPFGIGDKGCFREGFEVFCHSDNVAMLNTSDTALLGIYVTLGEVRVQSPIAWYCNYTNGTWVTNLIKDTDGTDTYWISYDVGPSFTVSKAKNKFTAIGCATDALIDVDEEDDYTNECESSCHEGSMEKSTQCTGMGCCQSSIPGNMLDSFSLGFDLHGNARVQNFSPCSYGFVVEVDWFKFDPSYIKLSYFQEHYGDKVPLILDWAIDNVTCAEAKKNQSSYACIDKNSEYFIVGTSIGFVLLVVCISALLVKCQKRQLAKEKERFFKQNGGHMLYQQILSRQIDTVIIFTIEDLKKATNNYDRSRELGRGGHGTVYKGILDNNKVVAVKRSKIVNVVQTEEFVQEIIILSQLNHRSVVRLLGCCLEVEVPILVYEYIPNGTLSQLIHGNRSRLPVSLEDRLRIAQESAEALEYLHVSINRPIVHGDVKSLNILLDENYMAKVTDFGASRMLPRDVVQLMTMVQGTLGYLDPEYLQERKLTEKSDVYSFGVVLLELITRKQAIYFDGHEEKTLATSFLQALKDNRFESMLDTSIMGTGMEELFQEVAELASRCLNLKGDERPSMTQVGDKLKAIRSIWRAILLLKHEETQCASSSHVAHGFSS